MIEKAGISKDDGWLKLAPIKIELIKSLKKAINIERGNIMTTKRLKFNDRKDI